MTRQGVAEMACDLWVPLKVRPQWDGLSGESQLGRFTSASQSDLHPAKCKLSTSAHCLVLLFRSSLNLLFQKAGFFSEPGWISRIVRKMKRDSVSGKK